MRYLLLLLMSFLPLTLLTQVKYDYNWFVATNSGVNQDYGLTRISFTESTPFAEKVFGNNIDLDMSNSSWSDSLGEFRYFTNGCVIVNSKYEIMENGDSINIGGDHDVYCPYGYLIPQGTIILPKAGSDTVQYLFHLWSDDFPVWGTAALKLYFTEINSNHNSGLGKVIQKNLILIDDTLSFGQFTAVKHANGKDWWLVMPENSNNGYYIVHLDEDGPALDHQQYIGTVQDGRDWGGQAVFSPDGRFYVRAEGHSGIEIFEFDRCRGKLYNNRHIDLPFEEGRLLGVAISGNSRYLYVSAGTVLIQYDLLAADIEASAHTVGEYDGFQSWLPTTFYMMQIGPDGKIYMTTGNGTNVMHVIRQPDLSGIACQFEQHAFQLPRYYSFAPPNFPNYNLAPAPYGYCDSLLLDAKNPLVDMENIKIYPNPAQDVLTVELREDKTCMQITLMNALGQTVHQFQPRVGEKSILIPISNWPEGLYHIIAKFENNQQIANKVLILSH